MTIDPVEQQTLLYLIALVEPDQAALRTIDEVTPVPDVRVENFENLAAVVREVPASMFTGDDAEDRLADVAWLASHAEAHDSVLRAFLEASISTWPSGFGSVFTTREALARRVASCAKHAAEYFDQVRGSQEWSLRIYADRPTIKRALQPAKASEATSGADYLRKKQGRSSLDAALKERALALVDTALDALEPTTVDIAERPVLETDESDGWQIAHIALLIDKTNQGSFDEALDQVAETLETLGLRFTLSGPWPSYSFCPRVGDDADSAIVEHST